MKIVKKSIQTVDWCLVDRFCPDCYPHKNPGFCDGGLAYKGDVVEFSCHLCNKTWEEKIG